MNEFAPLLSREKKRSLQCRLCS